MRSRVALSDERGETLLELVIAILILGVLVVAIGSGVVVSVKVSGIHRDQSTAGAFLHNYAESIQSSYQTCGSAATPTYGSVVSAYASGLATPTGFNAPVASVKFWQSTPGTFVTNGGACPAADPGLQQVTFTLNSKDGLVTESLNVVVRNA